MPRLPRGPVTGVIALTAIGLSTLILFIPFLPIAVIKLAAPQAASRRCTHGLLRITGLWATTTGAIFGHISGVTIAATGNHGLNRHGHYLIIANHQSWADIAVLVHAFERRIPFPRFFIKQQLIWFPVIGFVCWALDFPFMKRYRKKIIARHPELKGHDLGTTRRACKKFRGMPVTVVNFAEGTRYTGLKRVRTRSPYHHLLRPRASGTAFVIHAMNDVLTGILDVTIAYSGAQGPTLWSYACGRISQVSVDTRLLPVPRERLTAEGLDDPDVRHGFQNWMNDIWRRKDEMLRERLHSEPMASCDRQEDCADAA